MKGIFILSILMTAVFAAQVWAVPIQPVGGGTLQTSSEQALPLGYAMEPPAVTTFTTLNDRSPWTVSSESTLTNVNNGNPDLLSTPLSPFTINELSIPLVPEPGSLLLLGTGIFGLFLFRRHLPSKR